MGHGTEAEANRRTDLVGPIVWLEHPISVKIGLRAGVGFPHLVGCFEKKRYLLASSWRSQAETMIFAICKVDCGFQVASVVLRAHVYIHGVSGVAERFQHRLHDGKMS